MDGWCNFMVVNLVGDFVGIYYIYFFFICICIWDDLFDYFIFFNFSLFGDEKIVFFGCKINYLFLINIEFYFVKRNYNG